MGINKMFKILLVLILIGAAGLFSLFFRFGYHDDQALAGFSAAYQKYDQAISNDSNSVLSGAPASSGNELKTEEALADLNAKASARISSLTKNDGELMKIMTEISDLAGKELEALKEYQEAAGDQSADMESLGQQFRDITAKRQAAYARFLELSGGKK